MANAVRSARTTKKPAARSAALTNPAALSVRRTVKPVVAVKAASVTPLVHAAIEAPTDTAGTGSYIPWAGSKPWSRSVLDKLLPAGCRRALFPCGGAASDAVGYAELFSDMVIGDANPDLVNAHRWVAEDVESALRVLNGLFTAQNNTAQAYARLRSEFNATAPGDARRAALFVYLMWHGTYGLCRFNGKGHFNTSFGWRNKAKKAVPLPLESLRRFAKQMARATFKHADLLATIAMAGACDVVLLDPPYRPAAGATSTHTAYTAAGFDLSAYRSMVDAVVAAARRGATVFVHDHDTTETRKLHAGCSEIQPVIVERRISGKRVKVAEAVFIYRPAAVAQAVVTPKIESASVASTPAITDGFNEFGMIDEPKLAVTFAGRNDKADATLWAHPVNGEWFAGYDLSFRTGEYQSETMLPSKLVAGHATASLAIESAAVRLLNRLDGMFPCLSSLVPAEARQVSAMRKWLHDQIELARANGFEAKPAFTFIDLFSGIGAFHLAMKQADGKCVLACEINPEARKTYLANHDMAGVPFHSDITQLAAADVPDHDVLCAGFPCQAFSIAGNKNGFEDQRGGLIFDMLRIIQAKQPKLALLENVKNFCKGENGRWSHTLRRKLAAMGYAVSSKVLNAADFGTAQERERVFFVAYRRDAFAEVQGFQMPVGDGKWVSVADILEADAPDGHYTTERIEPFPTVDKKSPLQRIGMLKTSNGKVRRGQDARVYDPAFHATTLLASQGNCGMYLVNGKARALTPRERARLQGFPDTFQPHPVTSHANKQFGNSIAVPVAAALGRAIANQFFEQAA